MKWAYSSNAYTRCSVLEAVDRVAALGYDGIELMADVPHLWPASTTDEQITAVRRRLDERGLRISNVNAFMMNAVRDFWHPSWIEPDEALRRRRIEHTIAALKMAKQLGAGCITTEPGGPVEEGMTREEAMGVFVDGLNEALRHAQQQEVRLLVEPEPGLLIERADEFLELAERIDSPMFGLNLDLGHCYCVGEPLPATIERLKGVTRHYHIEDIAASRVHQHLIPGRGAIDFGAALSAIRRSGYRGWITVELYPYVEDPDAAGAAALRHLSNVP